MTYLGDFLFIYIFNICNKFYYNVWLIKLEAFLKITVDQLWTAWIRFRFTSSYVTYLTSLWNSTTCICQSLSKVRTQFAHLWIVVWSNGSPFWRVKMFLCILKIKQTITDFHSSHLTLPLAPPCLHPLIELLCIVCYFECLIPGTSQLYKSNPCIFISTHLFPSHLQICILFFLYWLEFHFFPVHTSASPGFFFLPGICSYYRTQFNLQTS